MSDKRAARIVELEREYQLKGCSLRQARRKAETQYVHEYVGRLKVENPVEYARLQRLVQDPGFAIEERRRQWQECEAEVHTRAARAARALVSAVVPVCQIPVDDYVAFRSWTVNAGGWLQGVGAGSSYEWREFNVADRVPTRWNQNGLYSYRIDPQSLITGGLGNHFNGKCVGLVSVSGKVLEHDDGVIRAEVARILCLWYIAPNPSDAYVEVPQLLRSYPVVPLFVTTRRLAVEALFKIGVVLMWRREKGFGDEIVFARDPDETDDEEFDESFGVRCQW